MNNDNNQQFNMPNDKKKKDYFDNYYWGFLGFIIPIIGAILIYFWTGKKEKSVKGIAIGMFFAFAIFLTIGIIYITGN